MINLNPFHTHRWVTTSEIFSPPIHNAEIGSAPLDLITRFGWGFTTIRQACSRCGAARSLDALGDVRTPAHKEVTL